MRKQCDKNKKWWKVKNCIVCLKKATIYTGHVMKENLVVSAGFCEKHQDAPCASLLGEEGCFGGWHKEYGITEEIFT